jgi:exopolysaccharide biosynthesis polyprenyl glycosylphosphotransferase
LLKNFEKPIANIQRLIDFFLAFVVWMSLYFFRFSLIPKAQEGLFDQFFKAGLLLSILTVIIFSKQGLYKSYRQRTIGHELFDTFKSNTLTILIFVALVYLISDQRLSRAVIIGYAVVSSVAFLFLKLFIRKVLRFVRLSGKNLRHIVLIGRGKALNAYVKNILSEESTGIRIKGWIDSQGQAGALNIAALDFDFIDSKELGQVDVIVVGYEGSDLSQIDFIFKKIYNDVIPIVLLPDLTYAFVGYQVEQVAGVPAFIVNQPKLTSFDFFLKRTFDFVLSGIGLLILSPVFLLIAALVKVSSPGSIFFSQERVSLDGQRFKMWKFRTMKMGSDIKLESDEPGWTVENDPRRTFIGSWLRRLSLDELPQLWNVFIGEMSLVGPRPEQPFFVEKFKQEIPAYMLRHKMKTGITGWAQVNGWRGDTSLIHRIDCDLYYIRNWSLSLDIEILFKTLWKGLYNKNAY